MDFYKLVWPLIRPMDPERAHALALRALETGMIGGPAPYVDEILHQRLWGMDFPNPIGLAAGFDKNAKVYREMLKLGFGFVEVGSVTPLAQSGNPRPRLFRLESDRAVINRMGFNNEGMEAVAARLEGRTRARDGGGIVGVNLGKNKSTVNALNDYVLGTRRFTPLADYLVVNVSSPNTPGLRALQGRGELLRLLGAVMENRAEVGGDAPPPLLLKIAPDLTDEDKADIAAVALETGIDGLIVSNTTICRPSSLTDPQKRETGGLSGRPLFAESTRVLGEMYRLTDGKLPLIGVGGVEDGGGAYAKIRAGASLVQLYSAMVYEGPLLANKLNRNLAACLRRDGFESIQAAIGADHR
ncbi:quinone-dependent dihydroorotate dehydrogenase [Varunaivibrio sulfuroxidans]|uniref:Dihydroorotate dehydrogenase (quinone) n=1 Tax=Varunaivibrio sulfuroxidans TaxID=1773489 RepID=A0A4V2UNL3_9PROT|nr:quinone-dependent dihydroorotate dehydrogenase [Varunaivibrio sulfuroxidans]TCS62461.1 dihydroorotate oxidase A [Varunaivibrio sulfuroxidans]WES30863.1 quinone-dependent dihydroorotate dehydrogenase [Varunaivibrio sulfuroxidans]